MSSINVLEVGPGVRPTAYAFDPTVSYLGIEPDMHYLVAYNLENLLASIQETRGSLSDFEYRYGHILSDFLGELTCTQSVVVMANVLGDGQTYHGQYGGLFVDTETGATRRTDITQPRQLITQSLQCLVPGGKLVMVEDAIGRDETPDHVSPEEMKQLLAEDPEIQAMLSSHELHSGADYLQKVAVLYPDMLLQEPVADYYETCFVAELQAKV